MTREQAIITLKVVDENASCDDCLYYNQMEDCPDNEDCIIRQALEMSIKVLEQEPCNTDTCKVVKAFMNDWDKPNNSDAISRQTVKEQMIKYGFHAPDMPVTEFVEDLPSVNPQAYRTIDKIKAIIDEWKADTWTDNFSYECMRKISEMVAERNNQE